MKAILPAAGYAVRMYPLTLNTPKPLLHISNKPVVEHLINKLEKLNEIDEILIVTNNRFYEEFLRWSHGVRSRIPMKIINDNTNSNEDRLGSLGDINFVLEKEKINDDVVIINADNLFTFELLEMNDYFKDKDCVVGLYDVKSLEEARKMGLARINHENKIIDFKEKDQNANSTLISTGIYFFSREIIKVLQDYLRMGNNPDRIGNFLVWLHKAREVYGHVFAKDGDKWFDIGSLETYKEADDYFKGVQK